MNDLFERLKQIPAYDAAQRQGIELKRNGYKFWACCPLHGERTPSMCFYPNGSWYCFGCHQGGDAVTLYEKMMQVSSWEAAERLAADFGIEVSSYTADKPREKPKPTVYHLVQALEKRRGAEWDKLCRAYHRANAILDKYCDPTQDPWNTREFTNAIIARTYAMQELDWLWQATMVDLATEYKEGNDAKSGGTGSTGSIDGGQCSTGGDGAAGTV